MAIITSAPMPDTTVASYRMNGGEALKISLIGQSFTYDDSFYALLVSPILPDGIHLREPLPIAPGQARYGPKRQLGWAKIAVPATNTIRNATQAEIDLFDDAEGQDEQALDAIDARRGFERHPMLARVMWSLIRMLVANSNQQNAKMNLFLAQWGSMKTIMASGVTVAQMRTQIAALPAIAANLPDNRTAISVVQAIRDDIQNGDVPRRGAP